MKRRQLFQATGGAIVLSAAALPALADEAPAPAEDAARIVDNLLALFAGTAASNASPASAAKRTALINTARARIKAMDSAKANEVFAGLPLGSNEANLTATFQGLADIALITRMPGAPADLLDNASLQRRVLDAMALVHQTWYGDQAKGYYGNWYHWEIGMPTQISKVFGFLLPALDQRRDVFTAYLASMDAYLRNGVNGDVSLDSRFHKGANLADITTNRIIQGAIAGDPARIAKALSDQLTVYATVDPDNLQHGVTDGYYEDGSFIQHSSVPYTGSYGRILLGRSVQTIKLLRGTSLDQAKRLAPVVTDWITRGFAPLIFEGWMHESVKGRGVSRTTSGYTDTASVVEAAVDLSRLTASDIAIRLARYAKYLAAAMRVPITTTTFTSPETIVCFDDIRGNDAITPQNLVPDSATFAFNQMARNVHVRPGWTLSLARNSDQISKYEYMSGENLLAWFQAEGTHYLYLAGEDQASRFGCDFFATVGAAGLPGTITPVEKRLSVPEAYGRNWYENPDEGFTSSSVKQNQYVYFPRGTQAWSGGATLDRFAASGMVQSDDEAWRDHQSGSLPADFVAYPNARATRSWFMFDDQIVCLAAGVGDDHGRAVRVHLDTRTASPGDDVRVVAPDLTAEWPFAHYENSSSGGRIGYQLLSDVQVRIDNSPITASRRSVRLPNPDQQVTRQVFSMFADLAAGETRDLAWAILPGVGAADLTGRRPDVRVLSNSTHLQAVEHPGLGIVMMNAFSARAKREHLTFSGPTSIVLRRRRRSALAISDPTLRQHEISLHWQGPKRQVVRANDRVRVRRERGGLAITINTRGLQGRSVVIETLG